MLYQSRNNQDAEHMSVEVGGEIKFKSKAELKRDFGENGPTGSVDDIARFNHSEL